MKNLKVVFLAVIVLISVTSCIDEPEFRGASNFKIDEFNQDHILFNVDISVFNPNGFALKVRKSTFDLYINDVYIGEAKLLDKYKMKSKTTTLGNVPVEVKLGQGVIFQLMRFIKDDSVKLRLNGKLKASALCIPNKQDIDQTKTVNLKDMNFDIGKMLGK